MKLKFVSKNMRDHYKELTGIREANQKARLERPTPLVKFTKSHELKIQTIERMEVYLSPAKLRA